jgi:hypothetical protein
MIVFRLSTIGSFSDPESSEDEFPPEELVDEGPNTGFVHHNIRV